jgi:hypothetical protein
LSVHFAIIVPLLLWVNWFNHCQLLEPIGNIPPEELEKAYYQQMKESGIAV